MNRDIYVDQNFTTHEQATQELRFAASDGKAGARGAVKKQKKNAERL